MKKLFVYVLMLLCAPVFAQTQYVPANAEIDGYVTITGKRDHLGSSAALRVVPRDGNYQAIEAISINNMAVSGHSSNSTAIFGTTNEGIAGHFTALGNGTALRANGPVNIPRLTKGKNLIRIYHPVTGVYMGEYEIEIAHVQ